jgi:toxin FitB
VKWLLDTNVVSETVKERPHQAVLSWLAQRVPDQFAISIVTMAELQDGAANAGPEARRKRLSAWIDNDFISVFGDRVLPLTSEILVDWLGLSRKLASKGITRAAPDLLIAATARIHDLIVVTRNVRDFADTGVIVYDPWASKTQHMEEQ